MADPGGPLVGRDVELARLRDLADAARRAEPRVVLIHGEAGIGKSRLVSELARGLEAGGIVLAGSCPPVAGPDFPLAPITQLLRRLDRSLPPDQQEAILGPSRAVLATIAPTLAGGDGVAADVTFGVLVEHILAVIERLADRHALVAIVLEDLQWGGPSTWHVLAHLARNLQAAPVLVVVTFRREALAEDERARELLAELETGRLVESIELQPLDPDRTRDVARAAAPAIEQRRLDTVVKRAGGNPLFAAELAISGGGGERVPDSLRALLVARLEQQPDDVRRVLRVAAVLGRPADAGLLVGASRLSEAAAIAALRHAHRAGILATGGQPATDAYAYRHELVREAVYEDLVPGERARLHGEVATALASARASARSLRHGAESPESVIELATHLRESGDLERAMPALLEAAAAAADAFAFAEADRLYEQAFGMAPEDPGAEWTEHRVRAAEAASLTGRPDRAVDHIETALADRRDDPAAPRWSERRARYLLEAGRSAEALQAYRVLVAGAETEAAEAGREGATRLLVAYARALAHAGRYREAGEVAERAMTAAVGAGHRAEEWQALNILGTARALEGEADSALEAFARARELASERRTESMIRPRPSRIGELLGAQLAAARALGQAGRSEEAAEAVRAGAADADRLGATRWRTEADLAEAWELYRHGGWAECRERCESILATGPERLVTEARVLRARLAAGQGDLDAADAHLEASEALLVLDGRPFLVAAWFLARAETSGWRRRFGEASAAVADGLATLGDTEDRLARAELCLAGLRAEVELHDEGRLRRDAGEAGAHAEAAASFVAEIRALSERTGGRSADGSAAASGGRWSGLVTAADAELFRLEGSSAELWAAAVAAWEAVPDPYAAAWASWRLAEAHLAHRDGRARAGEAARRAHDIAAALDARPLVREITALAARARIALEAVPSAAEGPRRPGSELGLSERELEVLALVANGRTNRQIAEALFITEKTAGHHVSNILAKLDVANRLEAASIAHKAGVAVQPDEGAPD